MSYVAAVGVHPVEPVNDVDVGRSDAGNGLPRPAIRAARELGEDLDGHDVGARCDARRCLGRAVGARGDPRHVGAVLAPVDADARQRGVRAFGVELITTGVAAGAQADHVDVRWASTARRGVTGLGDHTPVEERMVVLHAGVEDGYRLAGSGEAVRPTRPARRWSACSWPDSALGTRSATPTRRPDRCARLAARPRRR